MPTSSARIVSALHRFGLERDRLRTALARTLGIPVSDLDALEHLEERGPLTQRELGRRLPLSSGAVTMLVDRLERAGLVTRRPNPADRRSVLLELRDVPSASARDPLRAYHRATAAAADAVPHAARPALAAFLEAARAEAESAADALVTPAGDDPSGVRPPRAGGRARRGR
jgi:DNA-binding MarR family transcriptional regulator